MLWSLFEPTIDKMNKTRLLVVFTLLIACDKSGDVPNPLQEKVIGTYEGFLNYGEIPIGDDQMVEPVTFNVVRQGENNIKISTTFDLVVKVGRSFVKSNGDEIVTLGEGQDIHYDSDGIEILCGGTDWNNWGEMCGYYNVGTRKLTISFAWSDGKVGGSGFIFAYKEP
jgi:hypothetical protein